MSNESKQSKQCGSVGPNGGCQLEEGHEEFMHKHVDQNGNRTRMWTSKEYDLPRRRIPGADALNG